MFILIKEVKMEDIVRDYVELSLKLKRLGEERKLIKQEFTEKEEKIKNYMVEKGIGQLNLANGSIKLKTSSTKAPLNRDFITDTLSQKLPQETAQELTEHILETSKSKVTEKSVLKLSVASGGEN